MTRETILGHEFIADTLKKYGTTHVFYQELAFYHTTKNLADYGIENILAHSEVAAAYMADGYARATNKPGVCMSQAIGSANLAAGLHDAWLGNTPVIALTGFKPDSALVKGAYQESDHHALFSGATKFNERTLNEQQLPFMLKQCFRAATTGKPRPVHLDVIGYAGELAEKTEMTDHAPADIVYSRFPAIRSGGDINIIKAAAALIDMAKKPIVVAGRGAKISDSDGSAIYALITKGDIPLTTTPDGKTILDETDPLWAGVVGGYGMDCANKSTRSADLVIYIGSMVSDQTTLNFTSPPPGTKVIQIDIDGTEPGKNYANTLGIIGDAKTVIEQLTQYISDRRRPEWRAEVARYVANTLERQEAMAQKKGGAVETAALCKKISDFLPDDAIVVADTGWSATWASTMFRMKPPQHFMRAAGSLGWSFPAALGAKCGTPNKPVICFCGDGGFYYYLSELETALRYGINTVTIINNNSRLNQCIPYVSEAYAGQDASFDLYRKKVTFQPVRFASVAKDFGGIGIRVERVDEIEDALHEAIGAERPVIVEVITDPDSAPLAP